MVQLLALPYSPWSEKARWALDARRVPYAYRVYTPLLGEPALRLRLRRWTGPVTVPILIDDGGACIADSADIARWADARGEGPRLFPPEHAADIEAFITLSERALAAGRALSLRRMLHDDDALREMVPRPLRRVSPGAAARIAKLGIARTLRKYPIARSGASPSDPRAAAPILEAALDELRRALAAAPKSGDAPPTLLGHFTFADIAAAQALAFVDPPTTGLRIGRSSRRTFTDESLRERYEDLVRWRDALYGAYRG
jgi:glutathione S-transferase